MRFTLLTFGAIALAACADSKAPTSPPRFFADATRHRTKPPHHVSVSILDRSPSKSNR
jgi:hypothetical protein